MGKRGDSEYLMKLPEASNKEQNVGQQAIRGFL